MPQFIKVKILKPYLSFNPGTLVEISEAQARIAAANGFVEIPAAVVPRIVTKKTKA